LSAARRQPSRRLLFAFAAIFADAVSSAVTSELRHFAVFAFHFISLLSAMPLFSPRFAAAPCRWLRHADIFTLSAPRHFAPARRRERYAACQQAFQAER